MNNIKLTHSDYEFYLPLFKQARDIAKGEKALKDADLAIPGTYILQPCPSDKSTENKERYKDYVKRASLFNFTNRTEKGMAGMVFAKNPVVELNPRIDYLLDDADGGGMGIVQQAHETVSDGIQVGNGALFVDYPHVESATTEEDVKLNGIRANILLYKAENILDWRVSVVGSVKKLSYVKLIEIHEEECDDIFKVESEKYYRVLMINADGKYEQRLYDDEGEIEGEPMIPLNGQGKPFEYIPFFFFGAINNAPGYDPSPLQEIQDLQIKHYRNSAEWEESCYMVGQPTPIITGVSQQWVDDVLKGSISLGSRALIPSPPNSAVTLLQVNPNTMSAEGMKHKEEQAIALGARQITANSVNETAEAAHIKHSGDASVLKVLISNINQCYKSALKACADYMNCEDDSVFLLNTDFIVDRLDAQKITSLVASWQQGVFDKDVLDKALVKGGVIPDDVDLEAMNNNIGNQMQGVNL